MPTSEAAPSRRPPGGSSTTLPGSRPQKGKRGRLLKGVAVLVVEDDGPSARLAAALLDEAGAEVGLAGSAEEALLTLETFRPRVVLIDLILPRMSGLMLAQRLANEGLARDAVILAVSALNGPETKRLALEAGCAGYMRKPIDVETFAQVVASYVAAKP